MRSRGKADGGSSRLVVRVVQWHWWWMVWGWCTCEMKIPMGLGIPQDVFSKSLLLALKTSCMSIRVAGRS